jgi:succinyl-CoA synthetase beta subunit
MYIAFMMDRKMGGPAMIVSPHGGMDIETVAKDTPDAIFVVTISFLFFSLAFLLSHSPFLPQPTQH